MSLRNKLSVLLASVLVFLAGNLWAAQPGEFGDKVSEGGGAWMSVIFWVLVIVLVGQMLAIIGRVLQVYELSTEAAGQKKRIRWDAVNGVLFLITLIGGLYLAFWELNVHGKMTLPEAASEHGQTWDSMFSVTFIITFIVFVATHILLLGFAYRYRGRKGRKAFFYPHNDRLEVIWTVVPAIVLTLLVVFGWISWNRTTNPAKQAENPVVVEVVGRQFNWLIRYPGQDGQLGPRDYKLITAANALGVDFTSETSEDDVLPSEIVLPVGQPVKVVFGALDVIHSAYIPTLRVQMNTVPGIPTFFYFTPLFTTEEMKKKLDDPEFEYMLYCNKICGSAHYNMSARVRVVSEAEYSSWLASQQPMYTDELKQEQLGAAGKGNSVSGENKSMALNIN